GVHQVDVCTRPLRFRAEVSGKRTRTPHSALELSKSRSVFSAEPLVKCRHLTTRVDHVRAGPSIPEPPIIRACARGRGSQVTSRPWTFRAAATGVALAAVTATCSAFTVAQADTADKADRPGAVERHDPAEHNHVEHDLAGPMSKTQAAQHEEALNQVISGKTKVKNRDGSKVVQLKSKKGDAKYVELGREKTDKIFTILVEFGDEIDSRYGGAPGPRHNQIAKPDRKVDNSTAWQADYDQQHFEDLYFGHGKGVDSVKTYYEKQSS